MLVATEGLEGEEGGSKDTGGGNRTLDITERVRAETEGIFATHTTR